MHIGSVKKLYAFIFCSYFVDLIYSVSAVFSSAEKRFSDSFKPCTVLSLEELKRIAIQW